MSKIQKICRGGFAGFKLGKSKSSRLTRALKRILNRARRRSEQKDPENAGKRVRDFTGGWSD